MRNGTHPAVLRYGFVLLAVAAALLLRMALWPLLGDDLPFLFLWPAVMCCAWYGGFGPGLLATFLSAVAGRFFVLEPLDSLAPAKAADAFGIVLYLSLGIFLSVLIEGFHRARRQVEQYAEGLASADRCKNEFLAMLAHELRHPLAPIKSALHILRHYASAEPHARQATDIIDRQSEYLRRLVEDLMDVSRISRGKVTLNKQPVDLTEIVQRALETSRPLIDARKHTLILEMPEEPILLEADPARLTQVVVNLLTNAAKYTNEAGHIALTLARKDGQAILRIKDNGIGISAEMLPRVFDLYAQSEGAVRHAPGGLGIGLRLVRAFVELHSGSVVALSEGPGCGSEFVVRLPVIDPARQWQADPQQAAQSAGAAPALSSQQEGETTVQVPLLESPGQS